MSENLSCFSLIIIFRVQDGETPIMVASDNGHEEIVRLLISAGGNVNVQNQVAAMSLAVVLRPLSHDTYTLFQVGCSPLIWAARKGETKCVRALLAAGANVQTSDKVLNYIRLLLLATD